MACPFFMPVEKLENGAWAHPSRLPLGGGWSGHCTASGHEAETPSVAELQDFCNLGYSAACPRLPQERPWDAIRFAVTGKRDQSARNGSDTRAPQIQLRYVCERAHCPADHGLLTFDPVEQGWLQKHPDPRIQKMAECFLQSYSERMKRQEETRAAS